MREILPLIIVLVLLVAVTVISMYSPPVYPAQRETQTTMLDCAGLFSRAFNQTYAERDKVAMMHYGDMAIAINYAHIMELQAMKDIDFLAEVKKWDELVKLRAESLTTASALTHYGKCTRLSTGLIKIYKDHKLALFPDMN